MSAKLARLSTVASNPPILVLGGGIAGLACTYYLSKLPQNILRGRKIALIEGHSLTGGWLQSLNYDDGVVHELGPRSIRTAGDVGKNTLSLVEELGLESEIIGLSASSPAAKKRLILVKGQLHTLPSGFFQLFRTQKPFSKPMISSVLGELTKSRFSLPLEDDISVYDFFDQRFGRELADYISDPICRGITAGDCRLLSFKSMFPDAFMKTQNWGSLVKGMLLSKTEPLPAELRSSSERLSQKVTKERWIAWSLSRGLQRFPEALTQKLRENDNVELWTSCPIRDITFQDEKSIVTITSDQGVDKKFESYDVFCTLPSTALSSCLTHHKDENVKQALEKINLVNVAVACLEFAGKDCLKPDAGFGFLTPSFENTSVLGITFDSCTFPQHDAGKNITRLTCMMGGEWFSQLFSNSTCDQILGKGEESARNILGLESKLLRYSFRLHKNCIPQYYLGHGNVVNEIRSRIANRSNNFYLLGSSYNGVSVNDVIFNAKKAVQEFVEKSR